MSRTATEIFISRNNVTKRKNKAGAGRGGVGREQDEIHHKTLIFHYRSQL